MAAVIIIGGVVITSAVVTAVNRNDVNPSLTNTSSYGRGNRSNLESSNEVVATNVDKQNISQNDMLIYLIEEEKLAHDVYTVMYQKYGSNVFNNIAKSETNHQARVLSLLSARGLEDPRKTSVGSFQNQDLQQLYNKLIEQGNQSVNEAYKVAVAIEELDIADIDKQLTTATDSDIITTLNSLKKASQSHLKAFNRQLLK